MLRAIVLQISKGKSVYQVLAQNEALDASVYFGEGCAIFLCSQWCRTNLVYTTIRNITKLHYFPVYFKRLTLLFLIYKTNVYVFDARLPMCQLERFC